MLLAIDSATTFISLALHDGEQVIAESSWRTGNNHTVELAPSISQLLERAHSSVTDLTGLAVCIGPGTYSGLRVGVSLAKGMALARNLPLVGISTLDILAASQPPAQISVLITVAGAGRARVVAGQYHWRKGRWRAKAEPQNTDWDALLASVEGTAVITGEVDADGRAAIQAAADAGAAVSLAPAAVRVRRASFLAEEAWLRLKEGDGKSTFPAAQVVPLYVRTKDSPVS